MHACVLARVARQYPIGLDVYVSVECADRLDDLDVPTSEFGRQAIEEKLEREHGEETEATA